MHGHVVAVKGTNPHKRASTALSETYQVSSRYVFCSQEAKKNRYTVADILAAAAAATTEAEVVVAVTTAAAAAAGAAENTRLQGRVSVAVGASCRSTP